MNMHTSTTLSVLEDRMAIEALISHYNQSLDEGHYAQWVDCWSDEAFADAYEATYRSRLHALRHYTVNILTQIEGDTARSSSYLQLVTTTARGVQILFTGRYEDQLVRRGGRWQFARRTLHQDMQPSSPAAMASAAPSTSSKS
jgi:hypothetical protein